MTHVERRKPLREWCCRTGLSRTRFRCSLATFICLAIATITAQQWSEHGPVLGGRLTAIVAADGGRTLLVASPGGGVWRSADGGKSWTFPPNAGATDLSFTHLEWDVANPARLYGLTWNALYATTDRAGSWKPLINERGATLPLVPANSRVDDPKPFAQLPLGGSARAVVTALPCSGLFYSFDGVHFTQHWPFPNESSNRDNCIGTIVADAVSRRIYFSTMNQGRIGKVFRSDCGSSTWQPDKPCLTWQQVGDGLPANSMVVSMVSVSAPGSGDRLVAQLPGPSSSLATYLTTDGVSWSLQSNLPRAWAPRALIHPASGPWLFAGYVALAYSPDLGVTWEPLSSTLRMQHPDFRSIHADASAGKLWAVNDGSQSGAYANILRFDWKPGQAPTNAVDLGHAGLTVWQAYYATVVARGSSRRVFIGAQDNGSLCADDVLGQTWGDDGAAPVGGDSYIFQQARSNPNRAYAWANDPNEFVRTENAVSASSCAAVKWTRVKPQNDPPNESLMGPTAYWSRHNLAVHPRDPDRLYFALNFGVGVTANAGAAQPLVVHHDLQLAPANIPTSSGRRAPTRPERLRTTVIFVDTNGAIYVGTENRGLFKSTDDGATWQPWGLNDPSPALVTAIASSQTSRPTFWAATTDGLYRLAPGEAAWKLVTGEGRTVSDVTVDHSCPTRVYAAFGFAGPRAQQRGGVSVTSDDGATWISITSGELVDRVPVTSVEVDPQHPKTVYASTYGRGFWVLDWGSRLPECGRR